MKRNNIMWGVALVFMVAALTILASLVFAEGEPREENKQDGRAWMGIYMQDLNDDLAEVLDLGISEGVLISDVIDDSPAEKAGLDEDDVIVRFGDRVIDDTGDLTRAMRKHQPGDEVVLQVVNEEG